MSDYVIAQREYYTQGGASLASPVVVENMGRYRSISFQATTVTKVEASVDGLAYVDITGTDVVDATVTGLAIVSNACFKTYRITGTGTLLVNAN